MEIKTIVNYIFRDMVLILVIWILPYQNPSDEDETCSLEGFVHLKSSARYFSYNLGTLKCKLWKRICFYYLYF